MKNNISIMLLSISIILVGITNISQTYKINRLDNEVAYLEDQAILAGWGFCSELKNIMTEIKTMYSEGLRAGRKEVVKEILKVIEEERKVVGIKTHCETCHGHRAAGECDCDGFNFALDIIKEKINQLQ